MMKIKMKIKKEIRENTTFTREDKMRLKCSYTFSMISGIIIFITTLVYVFNHDAHSIFSSPDSTPDSTPDYSLDYTPSTSIINLYQQADCLNIKSEIYNSDFCQSRDVNPYSNESNARQHMCYELVKSMCQITDEFTKDSIIVHNPRSRELYIPLDPCGDSFDTIQHLFQKNTMVNKHYGISLIGSDINISHGSLHFGTQNLVNWGTDCKSNFDAPFGHCFDICISDKKVDYGFTLSLKTSDKCCLNTRRREGSWLNQIDADLSPLQELKKIICKNAPSFITFLGDKGANWLCTKGEGYAVNVACDALLDSLDVGWIPDVSSLCAQLLEEGLNDLGLQSECDKLADEGADIYYKLVE